MTLIANHPADREVRISIAASTLRAFAAIAVLVLFALISAEAAHYYNSYPEIDAAQMLIGP